MRTPGPLVSRLSSTSWLLAALALSCAASDPADNTAGSAGSAGAGTIAGAPSSAGAGAPTGVSASGAGGGSQNASGAGGQLDAAGGSGGTTSVAGTSAIAGAESSAGASGSAGASNAGAGGSAGASGSPGAAGASSDPCGPGNPAAVPLPTIPSAKFDVTTYGALGDDKTDNTKALQAALSAASNAGGGTVVVPKGTFLSGPLVLGNSTALQLSTGAMLKMLPRASYPSITPLLSASKVHDIALLGPGTIEGQGQAWWDAFAADSSIERPQQVSLGNSTRVLISGVRFQNSPEEHIWVKGDTDLTITGITISTLAVSGKSPPKNTDGVDMTATGAFFCDNDIVCGDDNIAVSGTNLYLGYSRFGVGHGCSIGSITSKGSSNVTVDHLTFDGTTSGIRMKSGRDRGGLVQNLSYSNITMTNVQNPVFITSYYPTLPADPKADSAQAITATTPYWKNITIKNLTATGSTNGGIIWGLPEVKISNLTFDSVHIAAKTGMQIFHADGVTFSNGSAIKPQSGAAVTTYDASVSGAATTAY